MSKEKRLGQGIEALFSSNVDLDLADLVDEIEKVDGYQIMDVNIDQLTANPYQPRKNFDEEALSELADSIKEHGVIQPLVVRKTSKGYDILAGERRFRASKLAGLDTVPVVEKDFDDHAMMELAILENIQREDLDIIEEANGYQMLLDKFKWTQKQLADRMGKSRAHITNTLRLLSLPQKVQELLMQGELTMGHTKVLVGMEPDEINFVVKEILDKALSVRQTEQLVMSIKNKEMKRPEKSEATPKKSTDIIFAENELTQYLGAKVDISKKAVTINYEDVEDLNRIFEIIGFDLNK